MKAPQGDPGSVFISHASEDTEVLAAPLAQRLHDLGLHPWIDAQADLQSINSDLNNAIATSRYAVVLLSRAYLRKDWTLRELDALMTREVREHRQLVTFVWHEITKEEVGIHRPLEAARFAMRSSMGLDRLAAAIARTIANRELPNKTAAGGGTAPIYADREISRPGELETVFDLLEASSMVTLWGPPGVGKTRLAAAVASSAADRYQDGVYWVEGANVPSPADLLAAVGRAVGLWDIDHPAELLERLRESLRPRWCLLIVDNIELLLPLPDEVIDLVRGASGLRMLTTSQRPAGVNGEQLYPVVPLSVDSDDSEAYQLFLTRARQSNPRYAPSEEERRAIVEICRLVAGLPLLVELAAAKVLTTSPGELFERLERAGLPQPRGADEAIREDLSGKVMAWAYGLLTDAEAAALRGLALCIGGFEGRLGDQLAADGPAETGRGLVEALVSASLVRQRPTIQPTTTRYDLLEPVRLFALAALVDRPDELEKAQDVRLKYCVSLAKAAAKNFGGPAAPSWLAVLEEEHANLLGALDFAVTGRPLDALSLAVQLFMFWTLHGHIREGLTQTERAVNAAGSNADPKQRATALNRVASFARLQGHTDRARADYVEALKIARSIDDRWDVAYALNGLGHLALEEDQPVDAKAFFEEALEIRRADSLLEGGIGVCLVNLGDIAMEFSPVDLDAARHHYDESLELRLRRSDLAGIPISQLKLARLDALVGNTPAALQSFGESLRRLRELADQKWLAEALDVAAAVAYATERPREAAWFLGAAVASHGRLGTIVSPVARRHRVRLEERLRDKLGRDFAAAFAEGSSSLPEDALDRAAELGRPEYSQAAE